MTSDDLPRDPVKLRAAAKLARQQADDRESRPIRAKLLLLSGQLALLADAIEEAAAGEPAPGA